MQHISEARLRQYIRGVILEASLKSDLDFLRTAVKPIADVVLSVKAAEEDKDITPADSYLIINDIGRKLTQSDIASVISTVDTFSSYGDKDEYVKDALLRQLLDVAVDSRAIKAGESIDSSAIADAGELIPEWNKLYPQFVEELKRIAPGVEATARDIAASMNKKFSSLKKTRGATAKKAAAAVAPLQDDFDAALEAAVAVLTDRSLLKTFRSLPRNVPPQLSDIPKIQQVQLRLMRIASADWTPAGLKRAITDLYKEEVMKWSTGKSDPTPVAKQFIEDLKLIPDVGAEMKDIVTSADAAIKDSSEAPKGSPMGQIAFATSRPKKPYELNTDVESDLLHALEDHFEGSTPLKAKNVKKIRDFIANGWYSDTFKVPDSDTLYRGMAVSESWLQEKLGIDELDDSGSEEVDYSYGKPSETSSWTDELRIAKKFSLDAADDIRKPYMVVMHALSSDNPNSFIDCRGLYDLIELERYSEESECMGLGSIKVFKIEWTKNYRV